MPCDGRAKLRDSRPVQPPNRQLDAGQERAGFDAAWFCAASTRPGRVAGTLATGSCSRWHLSRPASEISHTNHSRPSKPVSAVMAGSDGETGTLWEVTSTPMTTARLALSFSSSRRGSKPTSNWLHMYPFSPIMFSSQSSLLTMANSAPPTLGSMLELRPVLGCAAHLRVITL